MPESKFNYVRPGTLEEAIALLNEPGLKSRPLAGGTDIAVYLHHNEAGFDRVVDIGRLGEMKVIARDGDVITVGAGVTFGEAAESGLLGREAPFLVEACLKVGSPQIRNVGTIGGNVMNAAACADSLPVLVCLDAAAHLRGAGGARSMPVSELVQGVNSVAVEAGELLTHFTFEVLPPGSKTAFIKLGRRNAQAISRLTVAAVGRLDEAGRADVVRLAPGAVTPRVFRFREAEDLLLGRKPDEELIVSAGQKVASIMVGVTGRRWSTEYKEPVIAALVERALRRVLA